MSNSRTDYIRISYNNERFTYKTFQIRYLKITFEPDQFPAAILRLKEGPVSLLFASGKIVIVGSKSEEDIINAEHNLLRILERFYIK